MIMNGKEKNPINFVRSRKMKKKKFPKRKEEKKVEKIN